MDSGNKLIAVRGGGVEGDSLQKEVQMGCRAEMVVQVGGTES